MATESSPEVRRLLLDTTLRSPDPQRLRRLVESLTPEQLDEVLVEAERHRTIQMTSRNLLSLAGTGADGWFTKDFTKRLENAYETARAGISSRLAELERVLTVLAGHGVSPVLLKGAAWAHTLYANSYDRTFRDLDILVATEEFPAAHAALVSAGYLQANFDRATRTFTPISADRIRSALVTWRHATPYRRYDDHDDVLHVVEVHGPVNDETFYRVDTQTFIDHSVSLDVAGVPARKLCWLDDFVYAAAHIHKSLLVHAPVGRSPSPLLRWYCDLREMILACDDLADADRLYGRAHQMRKTDAVYHGVYHLDSLFPDVVPKALLVPPPHLTRPVDEVVDDEWTTLAGTTTFLDRTFVPNLEADRYRALRDRGRAGGRLDIPHAAEAPPVAATFDEADWPGAAWVTLQGTVDPPEWQYFRSHVTYGTPPRSDDDLSARFCLCWCRDRLYLACVVRDDVQVFDQITGFYQLQDCVQLLVEAPQDSGNLKNLLLVPAAADLDGPAAVLHEAGTERTGTNILADAEIHADFHDDGYTVTASIPLADLGIGVGSGSFGLDFLVYDGGDRGQDRKTVLQWSGGRNAIRDPRFFGTGRLVAPEPGPGRS